MTVWTPCKTDRIRKFGHEPYIFLCLDTKRLSAKDYKAFMATPRGAFATSSPVKMGNHLAQCFFAARLFLQRDLLEKHKVNETGSEESDQ
jgi:hypothetical protein